MWVLSNWETASGSGDEADGSEGAGSDGDSTIPLGFPAKVSATDGETTS